MPSSGAILRRANDQGVRAMKAGSLSQAFDYFTEAIRLCPTSPVYHCNRAAAALKLGRPEIAAEDAAHATERDAAYLRAYLRGGQAEVKLQHPEAAMGLFQRALELDPSCSAATIGLESAQAMAAQQQKARDTEQAAAAAGARPGLGRETVAEEVAAQQLLAAMQMAEANPSREDARCAVVEGLIVCGRYGDAAAATEGLLPGVDRQYLEAEVLWRLGDVAAAVTQLEAAEAAAPSCTKCSELLGFLLRALQLQQQAQLATEDGIYQKCIEAATQLLSRLDAGACTGLYCRTLQQRAEALAARGMHAVALADLDAALAADNADAACLRLRAEVHRELGRYTDYFLDVQRLKKVAPGTPGLLQLLEDAAKMSLGSPGGHGRQGAGSVPANSKAGQEALQLLGLTASATAAQVRRAYLALAAKHHPDKWAAASEAEQQAAEAKFKEIQQAYEQLNGT